jgi:hypothetical protein
MESKNIEIVSTFRDRQHNPHPTDFRLDVNLPDKYSCVEAYDPVSHQAPLLSWTGNTVDALVANVTSLSGTVISPEGNGFFIVSCPSYTLFPIDQYYRGLFADSLGFVVDYFPVSNVLGRFRFESKPDVGNVVDIHWPVSIPNVMTIGSLVRFFVPAMYGCRALILYNDTLRNGSEIVSFPTAHSVCVHVFHAGWQYDHQYSLRVEAPATYSTILSATTHSITLNAIPRYRGDMVYIAKSKYFGVIANADEDTTTLTLSNPLADPSTVIGSTVETLNFSYDNYQPLRHVGTANLQERTWKVWILDVQIPNQPIQNARSLQDFSTLYLEFRDQHPVIDNIMTNNPNGSSALVALKADTSTSTRNFITYDAAKIYKTFRFSPNRSYFFIRLTTPEGDVVKFIEPDNTWPLPPKRHLQLNVSMMVQML